MSPDQLSKFDELERVSSFNWLSRQFHWYMAGLVFVVFALGFTMEPLELSKDKLNFYAWHKWFGLVILCLVVLRLIWRFLTKTPRQLSDRVPYIFHLGARIGHFLLYAVLIALPVIGWLRSSTAGFQIVLFEMIPVPDLLGKDEAFSSQLALMHQLFAYFLAFLIIGHVAAVIIHHLFFKDPILGRMKPHWFHKLLIFGVLLGGIAFYSTYVGLSPSSAPKGLKSEVIEKKDSEAVPKAISKKEGEAQSLETQTNWIIDEKVSLLEFTATQKSAKTSGAFKKYKISRLAFDASELSRAVVDIEIDVASLSLTNLLVEQTLASSQWFNVSEFPTAKFRSKEFKSLGGDKYQVSGDLQIKDVVKPAIVNLTIKKFKDETSRKLVIEASGGTVISRLAFKIGQGEWASTDDLADEVQLKIHIRALKNR